MFVESCDVVTKFLLRDGAKAKASLQCYRDCTKNMIQINILACFRGTLRLLRIRKEQVVMDTTYSEYNGKDELTKEF